MRMYKQRRKLAYRTGRKPEDGRWLDFLRRFLWGLRTKGTLPKKELQSLQQRKTPACHWRDILRCCNEMGTLLAYKYPVFAASL
ncbi:hypothetical protein DXF96_00565 [Heyndrickxia coagulans]|nr:hypothetical protein CYJ15_13080 [Heyndrickxia coagulans]QDI60159.1 hypothetical protein DXF96_00565 [Heyndrickxia coagulans]